MQPQPEGLLRRSDDEDPAGITLFLGAGQPGRATVLVRARCYALAIAPSSGMHSARALDPPHRGLGEVEEFEFGLNDGRFGGQRRSGVASQVFSLSFGSGSVRQSVLRLPTRQIWKMCLPLGV